MADYKWIFVDWSNNSSHDVIKRPTEIECFRNLEVYSYYILKYGLKPKFTPFEKKILHLDYCLQCDIIPLAEKQIEQEIKETGKRKTRKPNVLHEIADITHHTPRYISKKFRDIENKLRLLEYLEN